MLDTDRRELRSLDLLERDGSGNEAKSCQRLYRRNNYDVGAAAQASITRTFLVGIAVRMLVGVKAARIGGDPLAGEDLASRHQQDQERDNSPDCGPVCHQNALSSCHSDGVEATRRDRCREPRA